MVSARGSSAAQVEDPCEALQEIPFSPHIAEAHTPGTGEVMPTKKLSGECACIPRSEGKTNSNVSSLQGKKHKQQVKKNIWPRRFPSAMRRRAEEVGAIELLVLLEFRLENRPRALRNLRQRYSDFCVALYHQLRRAGNGRG
jgi:hypothetical protein